MRNGAAQHIEARAANSTAMHGRILPDAQIVKYERPLFFDIATREA
jgi:hypothetical protein